MISSLNSCVGLGKEDYYAYNKGMLFGISYSSINETGFIQFDLKSNGSHFLVAYGENDTVIREMRLSNIDYYLANQSSLGIHIHQHLVSFQMSFDLTDKKYNFVIIMEEDIAFSLEFSTDPPKKFNIPGFTAIGWFIMLGIFAKTFQIKFKQK